MNSDDMKRIFMSMLNVIAKTIDMVRCTTLKFEIGSDYNQNGIQCKYGHYEIHQKYSKILRCFSFNSEESNHSKSDQIEMNFFRNL